MLTFFFSEFAAKASEARQKPEIAKEAEKYRPEPHSNKRKFFIIGRAENPILFCQSLLTNLTGYAIIQVEG